MSDLEWERTQTRLAGGPTEEALRRELSKLPDALGEWIGVRRRPTWLYLSRIGCQYDVVFQDEADRTWRLWLEEPRSDAAGVRPDLDTAIAWALDYAATGRVAAVRRNSEEDRLEARGVRETLGAEISSVVSSWRATPPLALQLHLDRPRRDVGVSMLVDGWNLEHRTPLLETTRQISFLAEEAPWCSQALPRLFLEVLAQRSEELPADMLRVLVLDDLPVEHAMASAELLGDQDATRAWRAAVRHDTARLWTFRADLQRLGKGLQQQKPPPAPRQKGFDFG